MATGWPRWMAWLSVNRIVRGVDHHHRAGPQHGELAVAADDRRRVLVDSHAEGGGIVRKRRQQAAQPVAAAEVLIDHQVGGEAETLGQMDETAARRGAALPQGDHVLGEQGRAGAGAGHHHAGGVAARGWSAAISVPPSTEESLSWLPPVMNRPVAYSSRSCASGPAVHGVLAGLDLQHLDVLGPQGQEEVGVALPRLRRLRGGREHHDAGVGAAGRLQEIAQDDALAGLVLGAADGDQQPGMGRVGGSSERPSGLLLAKRMPDWKHPPVQVRPRPRVYVSVGHGSCFMRIYRAGLAQDLWSLLWEGRNDADREKQRRRSPGRTSTSSLSRRPRGRIAGSSSAGWWRGRARNVERNRRPGAASGSRAGEAMTRRSAERSRGRGRPTSG